MRTIALLTTLAVSAVATQAAPISGLGDPNTHPSLAGGTVVDFDTAASGLFGAQSYGALTITGVDAPFTIGSDFIGSFNTRGVKSLYNDFDFIPMQLRFDFSSPVDAFGFNWGAADNSWTLQAYSSGGAFLELVLLPPVFGSNAGEYVGLAAAGISYAILTDTKDNIPAGDYIFIDNFTYVGDDPIVPDAGASLALLGLGLSGLVALRRKH